MVNAAKGDNPLTRVFFCSFFFRLQAITRHNNQEGRSTAHEANG
jgi:hypothetical protein